MSVFTPSPVLVRARARARAIGLAVGQGNTRRGSMQSAYSLRNMQARAARQRLSLGLGGRVWYMYVYVYTPVVTSVVCTLIENPILRVAGVSGTCV